MLSVKGGMSQPRGLPLTIGIINLPQEWQLCGGKGVVDMYAVVGRCSTGGVLAM